MTSPRLCVSAAELEDRWSFDDLMEAHDVLDALEDAEAHAMRQASDHG